MTEEILNEPNNKTMHDKLNRQLYLHCMKTSENATLIVMNPKTWQDLCASVWTAEKELPSYFSSIKIHNEEPSEPSTSLTYKGIKVLRSLDLPDGLFEIR